MPDYKAVMSVIPAVPYRPRALSAINSFLPAVWRLRGKAPDLNEATLERLATKITGLDDFGDDGFLRGQLHVLLAATREEARLNPFGRLIAQGSTLKVLIDRLRAEAIFKAHPEILSRPVVAPVVIVGHMRSGTTRLQRLLGADDRFAALRLYEAMAPVPSNGALRKIRAGRPDPRIVATRRALGFLDWMNPGIGEAHPTGALEVDEELGLLEASLTGAQLEAQRRIPSFARHGEATDQTPAYDYMRKLLQLAGWLRGEDPAKRWLLKTPQHLQDLPALLRVFPDAQLIFTHRDPVKVVASGASLVWNHMIVQSDHVEADWIGAEWLYKTEHRTNAAESARPAILSRQQHDVHFADMERDWRAEIRRTYAFLGMELTPAALAAMEAYIARAEVDHGHRRHRYRPEDFGLSAHAVAERFAGYSDRYDIAAEGPWAPRRSGARRLAAV